MQSVESRPGALPLAVALAVITPFAAAYFLSWFFRSINAIIAPDLVRELELTAGGLGFLTSMYFLGFALFQIPLGVLLDRFGARRVQASLIFVGALGMAIFALGPDARALAAGRLLIGIGFSGALMSAYKAIADWFSADRIPLLNGLFMGVGSLGAIVATAPAQWAVDAVGWRAMLTGLAIATALVAASIILVVPEKRRAEVKQAPVLTQIAELRLIYGDPLFWRVAPITFISFAIGGSVQGLWAAPWLRDVAGLGRGAIAEQLFLMAVALAIGSALGGVIAEALRRRGIGVLVVSGGFALLQMAATLGLVLELTAISTLLWMAFGGTINSVTLSYAALSQHFGPGFAGRSNTAINLLSTAASFACQFAIGAIINLWPSPSLGAYDPRAYQAAFGIALAIQTTAFLWFLLFRGERR